MSEDFSFLKITSATNEKIKDAQKLHLKKYRDLYGMFLVEGIRLVEKLLESDFTILASFVTPAAKKKERIVESLVQMNDKGILVYEIAERLGEKLSLVKSMQGIFAVAKKKTYTLHDIGGKNKMLIVLDGVKNPLNVGTILRTSEAAGVNGAILLDSADLYSAKVLRGTMGSAFHFPIIENLTHKDLLTYLMKEGFSFYAPSLDKTAPSYFSPNYRGNIALIFGNEGAGVSSFLQEKSLPLHIPMLGKAESLNVSSAAAVIVFEALRKRMHQEK